MPLDLRQSFYCSNWVRQRRLWTVRLMAHPQRPSVTCSLSQIRLLNSISHLLAILRVQRWRTTSMKTIPLCGRHFSRLKLATRLQLAFTQSHLLSSSDDIKFESQINYKRPNGFWSLKRPPKRFTEPRMPSAFLPLRCPVKPGARCGRCGLFMRSDS